MKNFIKENKTLTAVIFWAIWLILMLWLVHNNNTQPDLSSDYEEQEGQYYENGGSSHPLWP